MTRAWLHHPQKPANPMTSAVRKNRQTMVPYQMTCRGPIFLKWPTFKPSGPFVPMDLISGQTLGMNVLLPNIATNMHTMFQVIPT